MEGTNDAPSDVLDVAGEKCRSEFLQDSTSCEAETSDLLLPLMHPSTYLSVFECATHPLACHHVPTSTSWAVLNTALLISFRKMGTNSDVAKMWRNEAQVSL